VKKIPLNIFSQIFFNFWKSTFIFRLTAKFDTKITMVSHHIYKIHKLYNVIKHHNYVHTKTTIETPIEKRSKFQILFTITIAKGKKQHNKCQDLEQYVKG
jgi:isoprenylcysteine carboxyl methyltransferase (ICMT) family protein YpbQ